MQTVAVTGGSGKLGRHMIQELQNRNYRVISLDNRVSPDLGCRQIQTDLNDFGQVAGALEGADAVIHLAAIPAPLGFTNAHIFANNAVSGFHILEAASLLGIRKAVMGSSESSYGFAWAPSRFSPDYFPLDEYHPQKPQECYGLSKIVNELTGEMFHRRNGMQVISLRFSTIYKPEEYDRLDVTDPERHKHTLWSYIDIRDAASACIASLEAEGCGAVSLNITSDDTLSDWETERLLNHCYPDVKDRRRRLQGREAVVSNRHAKGILSWSPLHSWQTR
ncbi:NAD-dependent epimerase/dehydratase family protein [Cohnella silvisoli]|uniref:NAD(P)-dependent oxidoreductase n=1 Tax=Cohnella silvisoli TaxID=2873699 RepID=A0ABV1KPB9_9BACL|nr:NAD(P)-dependent oxidoreductase [Cohnella silvisoli]MCD9025577.1 NAD(P)-dependent oxidoreductase [Cohnella silvisoli]